MQCGEDEKRKAMAAEAFEDADVHSDGEDGGLDQAAAIEPVSAFIPENRASNAMLEEAGRTSDGSLMHLEVRDMFLAPPHLLISFATVIGHLIMAPRSHR